MKTTVITRCWNSERTLARCARSVLAQSSRPIEHIVVDGGSTDGTLRVLEELAPEYTAAEVPLRVLAQERRPNEAGIPSAWNQGLAAAQGEMIALLNSDDWYEPSALTKVKDAFAAASSELGIVVAPVNWCAPKMATWKKRFIRNARGWWKS